MQASLHTRFVAIAFLALWGAGTTNAQLTNTVLKSLTLHECIVRALANNLEIKSEQINPTIQSWGVVGAQSIYDPILSGAGAFSSATFPRDTTQVFTNALTQTSVTTRQSPEASASLGGLLPTGGTYTFAVDNFRRSSGNAISNFLYTGQASVNLEQPLLKNFGFSVNSANIRIARKSRAIAQQDFVQFVMNKLSEVSTAYYELEFTIEDHRAKVETLDEAKELLDQTRKRVQIGTQSPLDAIQAEAGVAERVQAVITSAQAIKDAENKLKRLISQQVTEFRGVSLIPMGFPEAQMVDLDVTRSIRTALEMRPDYLSAKEVLEKQNIAVRYNRNQLWPEINLQGSYGENGRGTSFDNFNDSVASGDNPVWSAGVIVRFPLGNRQARSTYNISRLNQDQLVINLKILEQNILVEVDNAVGHVGSSAQSVVAAAAATRAAQASLDAEKKKLLAGVSTTFLVLQAQSQLGASRSAEVRARASYSESLVALNLAEGTILQKNNVVLDESRP